jgi:hypothetical protein
MGRIFTWLVFALVGWIAWRAIFPKERPPAAAPGSGQTGDSPEVLACAHCGLYVPSSEMMRSAAGLPYCSAAHLGAASTRDR